MHVADNYPLCEEDLALFGGLDFFHLANHRMQFSHILSYWLQLTPSALSELLTLGQSELWCITSIAGSVETPP